MVYYCNLMANVEGKTVSIIVDIEAKNAADAIVKVLGTIAEEGQTLERLSIICHLDPSGKEAPCLPL